MAGSTLPYKERMKLWSQPPDMWLAQFKRAKYGNPSSTRLVGTGSGAKIIMSCVYPGHTDSKPSAACCPSRGWYKCQTCGTETDPVRLFAKMNGVGYANALNSLAKKFGQAIGDLKDIERAKSFERDQEIYSAILEASHAYLTKVEHNPTAAGSDAGLLSLTYATVTRKILPTTLRAYGIGILPTLRGVQQVMPGYSLITINDVRNATDHLFSGGSPDAETPMTGCLVAPYWVGPGIIGGLKFRTIKMGAAGFEKRDLWLTLGTDVERGFFGLDLAAQRDITDGRDVFLVEGEFDAMAIHQMDVSINGAVAAPVVAGSGGAAKGVDILRAFTERNIAVLPDHDAGGSAFVRHVLEDSQNIEGISILSFDATMQAGTDPYDWATAPGSWFVEDLGKDKAPLVTPAAWAVSDFKRRMAAEGDEDATASIRRMLGDYKVILDDPIYGSTLIDEIEIITGIGAKALRSVVTPDIGTGEGFDRALLVEIERLIRPLYVEDGNRMAYFSHKTRTVDHLDISASNVVTNFLNAVVAPVNDFTAIGLMSWVRQQIGVPSFISTAVSRTGKAAPVDYLTQNAKVQQHFIKVCREDLVSTVPPAHKLDRFKQGLHCMSETGDPAVFPTTKRHLHLINGAQHYTAVVDVATPGVADWSVNNDCAPYPGVLFEYNDRERWSHSLTSIKDLQRTLSATEARQLFEQVSDAIETCWYLEHGKVFADYLTAAIFTAVIQNVSESAFNMHVTGRTGAGKTTLLSGLFYASGDLDTTLVEHSHHTASYTEAGLRGALEGDARLFCIEEFEAGEGGMHDTQRNKVVNAFMEKTRDIYKGLRYDKFYASSNAVAPFMKAAMATTGIETPLLSQDANRRVSVSLLPYESKLNHPKGRSPLDLFKARMSRAVCARVREFATLFALQHVQNIAAIYTELNRTGGGVNMYNQHRTFKNALMQVAFMNYLGLDGCNMIETVCRLNAASLNQVLPSNEDSLFGAIFDTPYIQDPGMFNHKHSVRRALHSTNLIDLINAQDCGVYCPPSADYVVVLFPKVVNRLLASHPDYAHIRRASRLISQLLNHPDASLDYSRITSSHRKELNQYMSTAYEISRQKLVVIPRSAIVGDTDE